MTWAGCTLSVLLSQCLSPQTRQETKKNVAQFNQFYQNLSALSPHYFLPSVCRGDNSSAEMARLYQKLYCSKQYGLDFQKPIFKSFLKLALPENEGMEIKEKVPLKSIFQHPWVMKVQHPQHWNETHCEDGISQILTDMYKVTGKYTCTVQTKTDTSALCRLA